MINTYYFYIRYLPALGVGVITRSIQKKLFHITLSLYSGIICVVLCHWWYLETNWEETDFVRMAVLIAAIILCGSIGALFKKLKFPSLVISSVISFALCKYLSEITTDNVWYVIIDFVVIGAIFGFILSQLKADKGIAWISEILLFLYIYAKLAYLYFDFGGRLDFIIAFSITVIGLAVAFGILMKLFLAK